MGDERRRVIVTRPARDAAYWVGELANSGFKAQALPLIEIGPVTGSADAARVREAWRDLNGYAACMFVSANAVQYFFQQKFSFDPPNDAQNPLQNTLKNSANNLASHLASHLSTEAVNTLPLGLRFLAPGPGTAAALLSEGVPAAQVDSPPLESGQFDSEALWQVVSQRNWRGQRVLVLCGQTSGTAPYTAAGRDWLTQQFLAAGAQVDRLTVYQRAAPALTHEQIKLAQSARQDGSVWLFSSSEALANLMQQPQLIDAAGGWQRARAIATHPRIAQAVRAAGWAVVQESRPLLADIADALRSIESKLHE